ncbi:hypothetical protein [Acidipropionibacterium jensenii]|uniref:hypothetical protein n=1 Tax=Acidipropionibacterium jensenii TaxID=1749 RepID=UPI00214D0628|nr:hypothetical protein [Acidipropionibacterium jensenii]
MDDRRDNHLDPSDPGSQRQLGWVSDLLAAQTAPKAPDEVVSAVVRELAREQSHRDQTIRDKSDTVTRALPHTRAPISKAVQESPDHALGPARPGDR